MAQRSTRRTWRGVLATPRHGRTFVVHMPRHASTVPPRRAHRRTSTRWTSRASSRTASTTTSPRRGSRRTARSWAMRLPTGARQSSGVGRSLRARPVLPALAALSPPAAPLVAATPSTCRAAPPRPVCAPTRASSAFPIVGVPTCVHEGRHPSLPFVCPPPAGWTPTRRRTRRCPRGIAALATARRSARGSAATHATRCARRTRTVDGTSTQSRRPASSARASTARTRRSRSRARAAALLDT